MVYDEGFNMEFEEFSFFAFSKYSLEKSKNNPNNIINNSYCYETSIGWYHSYDKKSWGCFYGIKEVDNYSKPTSTISNAQLKLANEKQKLVEPMRFKQVLRLQKSIKPENISSRGTFLSTKKREGNNDSYDSPDSFFLEKYFEFLNNLPNKKFKIENYEEYKGMNYADLNMKAGRVIKSHFNKSTQYPFNNPSQSHWNNLKLSSEFHRSTNRFRFMIRNSNLQIKT